MLQKEKWIIWLFLGKNKRKEKERPRRKWVSSMTTKQLNESRNVFDHSSYSNSNPQYSSGQLPRLLLETTSNRHVSKHFWQSDLVDSL